MSDGRQKGISLLQEKNQREEIIFFIFYLGPTQIDCLTIQISPPILRMDLLHSVHWCRLVCSGYHKARMNVLLVNQIVLDLFMPIPKVSPGSTRQSLIQLCQHLKLAMAGKTRREGDTFHVRSQLYKILTGKKARKHTWEWPVLFLGGLNFACILFCIDNISYHVIKFLNGSVTSDSKS